MIGMLIENLHDNLRRYYDDSLVGFVVQLYARGGAMIRTLCPWGEQYPYLMIATMIQPDGDVITHVPELDSKLEPNWETYLKGRWETHMKKLKSRVDWLRRVRIGLRWLPYASIVAILGGLYDSCKGSFHWNWMVISCLAILVLLASKGLTALVFQLMLRRALKHFSHP